MRPPPGPSSDTNKHRILQKISRIAQILINHMNHLSTRRALGAELTTRFLHLQVSKIGISLHFFDRHVLHATTRWHFWSIIEEVPQLQRSKRLNRSENHYPHSYLNNIRQLFPTFLHFALLLGFLLFRFFLFAILYMTFPEHPHKVQQCWGNCINRSLNVRIKSAI